MSENKENVLPCNPASPRRSLVPGPVSEKLITEDCKRVGTQAPLPVNATGLKETKNNKKLVQQAFHPGLFETRPRSQSLGSINDTNTITQVVNTQTNEKMDTVDRDVTPPTWQRAPVLRNAKRRKVSSPSPERITLSNTFSGLPLDQVVDDITLADTAKKLMKPPPIILYGIEDLTKLDELLESTVNRADFSYKIINQNQLRINCANVEVYKTIMDIVRKKGLIGHTFNRKDKRPYRIVIKNLHHTTPKTIIKEALEETGNTLIGEIINVKYGPEKKPTSTFFANLQPSLKNKTVKSIKFIHHQSVTIEDPVKRTTIVQCQRCQQYGHSKNYCMRPFRCVKCAQSHKTSECPKKDRNTPAKCALCQGAHPANYKGCEVYREILARKSNSQPLKVRGKTKPDTTEVLLQKQPTLSNKGTRTTSVANVTKQRTKPNNMQKSYTEATKPDNTSKEENAPTTSKNLNLEELLAKQAEKFDLILQQMSMLINLITTLVSKLSK